LLVPVFGMASSALLLGERLTPLRLVAAVLIIAGCARRGAHPPAAAGSGDRLAGVH
jgi:O-acetylserine/cysteine efflux transporter